MGAAVGIPRTRRRWSLRFEQAMYREVAYEGSRSVVVARSTPSVGRVLERRAGEDWDEFSELLSLHFHHAGDWERSWRYSVIAGDRAREHVRPCRSGGLLPPSPRGTAQAQPRTRCRRVVAEALSDELDLNGRYERPRTRSPGSSESERCRVVGAPPSQGGSEPRASGQVPPGASLVRTWTEDARAVHSDDHARRKRAISPSAMRVSGSARAASGTPSMVESSGDAGRENSTTPRLLARSAYLLMTSYGMLRRTGGDRVSRHRAPAVRTTRRPGRTRATP